MDIDSSIRVWHFLRQLQRRRSPFSRASLAPWPGLLSRAYIHLCVHPCVHPMHTSMLYAYIYACTYIHPCYIHAYMHTYIHPFMHTYTHVYVKMYPVTQCVLQSTRAYNIQWIQWPSIITREKVHTSVTSFLEVLYAVFPPKIIVGSSVMYFWLIFRSFFLPCGPADVEEGQRHMDTDKDPVH
jgi:hypothetical protein